MAFMTSAIMYPFKTELLKGTHDFTTHTFKMALFTDSAVFDASLAAWSSGMTGEVSGTGYTAGGATLAYGVGTGFVGAKNGSATNDVSYVDWDNPSWETATFTARGALIYNTSATNKTVMGINFTGDKAVSNGTFTVTLPDPAATTAILQLA